MIDSVQVREMLVQMKRAEIEQAVERHRLLAQIGARDDRLRLRQAVARGLVRLAIAIDSGVGRRAAATTA